MSTYKIYYDKCIPTGKIYIGYTKSNIKTRWASKVSKSKRNNSNTKLENAIRRHGSLCWEHGILCETWSHKFALELEKYFIEEYNTFIDGYNSTIGGETPTYTKLTESHKKNISNGLKRSYTTGYRKPVKHSNKTKESIRIKKQLGTWHTPNGIFISRSLAADYYNTSNTNISNWCKSKNMEKITKASVTLFPHIFSKNNIGMTFKDIGFYFTPLVYNEQ